MNRACLILTGLLVVAPAVRAESKVAFKLEAKQLRITSDGKPFADYVFGNEKVLRPYFAHVHAPGGIQVTRNHPPTGKDATDHATMHPGLWLAFGELGGSDFWRNRGR